ncbi:MAG: hypothetical protein GAK29_03335 [Acinetobacter bereziniae]|uniref:Uncharacterized protein n=1 Tax=Acinetobacter bereziniae TaxID=106648 RepID=A0A833PE34_ACIBZ|nr:MAG: hypothetical protein GAK29_03335 [Acinetobacter bereziniae]
MTLSHPENFFHIAATAQIAYAETVENEQYRVGAYFITLHPQDKVKLAECIQQNTILSHD